MAADLRVQRFLKNPVPHVCDLRRRGDTAPDLAFNLSTSAVVWRPCSLSCAQNVLSRSRGPPRSGPSSNPSKSQLEGPEQ